MAVTSSNTVQTTEYHARYYAYLLSQRHTGDSTDKLASSLADALVDLSPHQIDAALFSFQSPLSNGVILADEVGLGKTIEAGLVISQFWASGKEGARVREIHTQNTELLAKVMARLETQSSEEHLFIIRWHLAP